MEAKVVEADVIDLGAEDVLFILNPHEGALCSQGVSGSLKDVQQRTSEVQSSDKKHAQESTVEETSRVRNITLEKLRAKLQIPPEGHFDRTDIVWEEITNQGRGKCRASSRAIIPWERLGDFVAGEESMRDFPCTFNEVFKVGHKEGQATNAKESSFLQQISFQCEYGPLDRTGEVKNDVDKIFANALKSKLSTNQKKAKKRVEKLERKVANEASKVVATNLGPEKQRRASRVQAGTTSKRGCQCNFVAKQLYMDNSLCEIQYHNMNHVNSQGEVCHGSSFAGFRHSLGVRLSWRTKNWIRTMLGQGFSPAQVMAIHKKEVWECAIRNMPCTRDMFIMPDDVYNLCKKRAAQLWQKHARDALSVRMWKEENEENVFHYQEFGNINLNEVAPEEEAPFCLGIQTPWQLEMMLRFGHNRQIAMDATFGTNEPKYPLYTVMVFDEWENGIPIAFIIVGKSREKDIQPWLEKLKLRCQAAQPAWVPGSMIVDNAQAELNAIANVWPGMPIMLCLWHVRKAWKENAVQKIKDETIRVEVLRAVEEIMYSSDLIQGEVAVLRAKQKIGELRERFPAAQGFISYFEETWSGKTAMWVTGNRNFPHCGQDTNAAIESYHANLKSILAQTRQKLRGRRMDWLVYHLIGDVLTHYWYGVQCKMYGFIKNRKAEGIVAGAVLRAREIPDDYVCIYPENKDIALVLSVNNYPAVWTVTCPDSIWAQCDCPMGMRGNICKHAVKVFKRIHVNIEDAYIIRHGGTLKGTIEAGIDNSVIDAFHGGSIVSTRDELDTEGAGGDHGNALDSQYDKFITGLREIQELVAQDKSLTAFALAQVNNVKGKIFDRQAKAQAGILHPLSQPQFDAGECDNNTRRHPSFLERSRHQGGNSAKKRKSVHDN